MFSEPGRRGDGGRRHRGTRAPSADRSPVRSRSGGRARRRRYAAPHVSSISPPHPHYSFSLPRPPLPSITSTLSIIHQSINALNILHFPLQQPLFRGSEIGSPQCCSSTQVGSQRCQEKMNNTSDTSMNVNKCQSLSERKGVSLCLDLSSGKLGAAKKKDQQIPLIQFN